MPPYARVAVQTISPFKVRCFGAVTSHGCSFKCRDYLLSFFVSQSGPLAPLQADVREDGTLLVLLVKLWFCAACS